MTLQMAKEAHDLAVAELKSVRFDRRDAWTHHVIPLYASMIEKSGSILTLFKHDVDAGVETIFRSILEAYVDLRNLMADGSYLDVCHLAYHQEWLRVLSDSTKGNPFLAGISSHEKFDEIRADHEARVKTLLGNDVKAQNVFQRFAAAGMEDVYRSAYNFAAAESHNNIRSLIDRHIDVTPQGGTEMVMYRGFSEDNHEAMLDSLCCIAIDASIQVHERFKSGREKVFHEFHERLKKQRESAQRSSALK